MSVMIRAHHYRAMFAGLVATAEDVKQSETRLVTRSV